MNRFTLEPYSGIKSRHHCPQCNHRSRSFKYYIDTQTGLPLADTVGRCDREESCGYHYTPKQFFKEKGDSFALRFNRKPTRPVFLNQQYHTLPFSLVRATKRQYASNNFVSFLTQMLGEATTNELIARYHIGTSRHWPGATVFWQVDINGRVRTGKIMLYHAHNCKRVKEPFNHIAWAHSLVGSRQFAVSSAQLAGESRFAVDNEQPDFGLPTANRPLPTKPTANFKLKQCLFGEHLLPANPDALVCVVESEKTAIIASAYMPQFIWLAAGSLNGLNPDKCQVLKGREVLLYPDANSYDKWLARAHELNLRLPTANFTVSDELHCSATAEERARGVDLADRWVEGVV